MVAWGIIATFGKRRWWGKLAELGHRYRILDVDTTVHVVDRGNGEAVLHQVEFRNTGHIPIDGSAPIGYSALLFGTRGLINRSFFRRLTVVNNPSWTKRIVRRTDLTGRSKSSIAIRRQMKPIYCNIGRWPVIIDSIWCSNWWRLLMRLSQDVKEFIELMNSHEVEYLVVGGWSH